MSYSLNSQLQLSRPLGDKSFNLYYVLFFDAGQAFLLSLAYIPFFSRNFSCFVSQGYIKVLLAVGSRLDSTGLSHEEVRYLHVLS